MNRFRRWVNRMLGRHRQSVMGDETLAAKLRENTCPDCDKPGFLEGPHGGMNVNIMCANPNCGSKFNIAIYHGQLFYCERISRPSPKAGTS